MFRPILVLLFLLSGCARHMPTPNPREIPSRVWAVSPEFLTRDLPTAKLYAGYRVRVTLAAKSYLVVKPGELAIPAQMPGVSPLIVFRCIGTTPPDNKRSLFLVGVCRDPVHDGVWRTHKADFWVPVDDCVITDVLGPSGAGQEP